jgi:ribonuclease HIII
MTVFTHVKKDELGKLKGCNKEPPKTSYEELRLKKGNVTLVLYTSGKLLLQGNKAEVAVVAKELEKLNLGQKSESVSFKKESGWIIGSDESLKGDTFGGIVVAAVKADEKLREKLVELGVADSKTLSDKEVARIAAEIRKVAPCEIKSIFPEEYNKHNDNITLLLNHLHKECADYLKPGKHIVDKYPGCSVGDVQEEKAESKYVEVAAASILARDASLKQLSSLSMEAGFTVPKGSTHVKLALLELTQRKLEPRKLVKLDFWNVREILEKS